MICQMKTESKWSLYRHITPSGKVYIGITSQKPEYRWNNGYVIKRYNSATEAAIELDIDIS